MGLRLRPSGRDRQIWCRHSSTKSGRLGNRAEQQSAGDPKAESRTALDRTASGTIGGSRCTTTDNSLQDAESSTRVLGSSLCFSGDESTWGDWSFKLRSYVSVVDLQLGRMMEAAELAAHASVWIPSEPFEPRHGRTARVRVRKPVPWHSCKRSCTLISGRSQLVSQIE